MWRGDRTGCFFCADFVHFIFFVGIHTVQSHLYQLSAPINMRFHHAVLLAALAIAPVCAERIKVSDERGIVDSTL